MWRRILGKVRQLFSMVRGFIETREEYSRRMDFKLAAGLALIVLLGCASLVYALLYLVYLACRDIGIHFIGVYIMIAAAVLAGFSAAIAKKIRPRRGRRRREITRKIRIISIVICASGLLLAILLG